MSTANNCYAAAKYPVVLKGNAWSALRAGHAELIARTCPFTIDLLRRGAQSTEDVLDEGKGDLSLAGVDARRTGIVQSRNVPQVRRSREDADARIQLTRRPDDLGAVRHARRTEDEAAGVGDVGGVERVRVG